MFPRSVQFHMRFDADPATRFGRAEYRSLSLAQTQPFQIGKVVVAGCYFSIVPDTGGRSNAEHVSFATPDVSNEPLAVLPREASGSRQLGRVPLPPSLVLHVIAPAAFPESLLGANPTAKGIFAKENLEAACRHLTLIELATLGPTAFPPYCLHLKEVSV